MGCPPEDKLDFITSSFARETILESRRHSTRPFEDYFIPDANPMALDLIKKMLAFHPKDRLTAEEALSHSYFEMYQGQVLEPTADSPFDFEFEKDEDGRSNMTEEAVRLCMYEEAGVYRPHVIDLDDDFIKSECFSGANKGKYYINPNRYKK